MKRMCAATIGATVLPQLLISCGVCWGQIAFVALQEGRWQACVQAGLDARPRVLETGGSGDVSAPALSPDGKRLAYEVQGAGIHVMDLRAGGEPLVLRQPKAELLRPTWHPQADRTPSVQESLTAVAPALLYVQYAIAASGEDSDLVGIDHHFKVAKPLVRQTGIQDYPAFSPDGRQLAYTSSQTVALHRGAVQVIQQLWIVDLTSGAARQVLLAGGEDAHPVWAPEGDRLAFASNRSGQFEIWSVHTDGSESKQLTSGPGAKSWPAWSPDGKSILFTMIRGGGYQLWLMDADGGNLRRFQPFGPGSEVEVRDADWK